MDDGTELYYSTVVSTNTAVLNITVEYYPTMSTAHSSSHSRTDSLLVLLTSTRQYSVADPSPSLASDAFSNLIHLTHRLPRSLIFLLVFF